MKGHGDSRIAFSLTGLLLGESGRASIDTRHSSSSEFCTPQTCDLSGGCWNKEIKARLLGWIFKHSPLLFFSSEIKGFPLNPRNKRGTNKLFADGYMSAGNMDQN